MGWRLLVVAWVVFLLRQGKSLSSEQMIVFCRAAGRPGGRRGARFLVNALMRQTANKLPDLMVNGNREIVPTNTRSALL